MQLFLYSVLHFLTDFFCAFTVVSRLLGAGQETAVFLYYNFCAFALQLPLGTLLDLLCAGRGGQRRAELRRLPLFFVLAGLLLMLPASACGPVPGAILLGTGNACFHVGGGVASITEDREKNRRGAELGVFVAPGALGLFFGLLLGNQLQGGASAVVRICFPALYLLCAAGLWKPARSGADAGQAAPAGMETGRGYGRKVTMPAILAVSACFIVVILRSLIGFVVKFPWKQGFALSLLAVLCVVLGKMLGGVLAARFGILRVMTVSLPAAAFCCCFCAKAGFGLAALLLFNMTMPLTLKLVADRFPALPGFSFGLLTLALFLGFIPVLSGDAARLPSGAAAGALGSLLSLALLLLAYRLFQGEENGPFTAGQKPPEAMNPSAR